VDDYFSTEGLEGRIAVYGRIGYIICSILAGYFSSKKPIKPNPLRGGDGKQRVLRKTAGLPKDVPLVCSAFFISPEGERPRFGRRYRVKDEFKKKALPAFMWILFPLLR